VSAARSPSLPLSPAELLAALRRNGGNVRRTARALGVKRDLVRRAMERAGLTAQAVRDFDVIAALPEPPAARRRSPSPSRPIVRRLAVEACDAPRAGAIGTSNGSGCNGAHLVGSVEVTEILVRWLGIRLPVQSSNTHREFWATRVRRRALVHAVVKGALASKGGQPWSPPPLPDGWRWRVTWTRIAHGTLDAHDNLRSAFKEHTDAVADVVRLSDRDPRFEVVYRQMKSNERAKVRRFDRKLRRFVMKDGFRCFFRVRIEQVKEHLR
jgi:hypothetical protein